MKRSAVPIGWARRDPRHYRFALPNVVWEYHLKSVEFMIFSYLCYHRSPGVLTPDVIAAGIHMTAGTVKKYLDHLTAKKLINEDGTPALKVSDKKFFTLPNEVFLLWLPSSAFIVYAYLLLIEDRRTHSCHPSYNTIAAATGLAKNTAMKSVSTLLEMGLIAVESSSYFDKCGMKWKGNNLYTILPVKSAVDAFYQRQFFRLGWDTERQNAQARLSRLCAAQEPLPAAERPMTPPAVERGVSGLCGPVCKVDGVSDLPNSQMNRGVEERAG